MGGERALQHADTAPPFASKARTRWDMQQRPAGPVALLLLSLGAAGLTIDTNAHIWRPFGNVSMISAPLHLYKSVVLEAAVNGVTKELHQRRPHLAPVQGID